MTGTIWHLSGNSIVIQYQSKLVKIDADGTVTPDPETPPDSEKITEFTRGDKN